jgi:UDP-N-acetylglucosamine--N-acetylmuramyl-(pentapeptide) pyrophosphoryl-undecaprenol N-acetylglucosamine transferase
MKVLLTGGGTGGHITPLLAVAQALKATDPNIQIIYVGERGSKFADLTKGNPLFDAQYAISAGKFRRYHGESWLRRIFAVKTNLQNIRDAFLTLAGIFQSKRIVHKEKPDVIFLKGGFVGVPVGLAAASKHIPFVTHDSDAVPGLANRLVGRWATKHATGMPISFYNYPEAKATHVGVLVGDMYHFVTPEASNSYRKDLNVPQKNLVLTVTGGSLGSARLNTAMTAIVTRLLHDYPNLTIVHQVGKGNSKIYDPFTDERLQVLEFLSGMHRYTGMADVIVTRAGANTLAELGVQGKAIVVVPNPLLTGGHQLKNAAHLAEAGATLVVNEQEMVDKQGRPLDQAIRSLLDNPEERARLSRVLHEITIPDASQKLAQLLLQVSGQGNGED